MPPPPLMRTRLKLLEEAMPPLLHRIAALERELTALLHARDLIEGALGTALERLADLERRLHALEGHPVPPRSALVPLDA